MLTYHGLGTKTMFHQLRVVRESLLIQHFAQKYEKRGKKSTKNLWTLRRGFGIMVG